MLKKIIFYIFIFNFFATNAQLNQEPKKITNKFFSELNDLENITPALKKKKGFTNYEELIDFIDEKVKKYPDRVLELFNLFKLSLEQDKIPAEIGKKITLKK